MKYKIVDINSMFDKRGKISWLEGNKDINFDIKRLYYLYDVPDKKLRGGHAHLTLKQLFIPIYGSFDILLDDGFKKEVISLFDKTKGLLIEPILWREVYNFSNNSVCLVLVSDYYKEHDYIKDYNTFLKISQGEGFSF